MDEDATRPMNAGGGRPTLAGRYALRGLLGQGGMADVELAVDTLLDRPVAVKILHRRYADDPSFLSRFRREAQHAASLNHPNIVNVYDTGEDNGRPFIVMEYVKGRSLRDLARSERLTPRRAAELVADAASGLHYAHDRGLVHRDVKPANILVSDDGVVKVTDFGIARAVNAETMTQTAAAFGTAGYVAPEQAQGENVDRRTDVYALGCVLYELLTARQPFSADSAVALAYKHVSEAPIPPTRLDPDISPELEAVVLKAMAKDPAHRYQTAADMQRDLMRASAGQAVTAPVGAAALAATQALRRDPTPTIVAPPRAERQAPVYEEDQPHAGRGAGFWFLLFAAIVAGLVVAGFLLRDQFVPEPPPMATVPQGLINQDVAVVEQALRDAGFEPVLQEPVEEPDTVAGQVLATDPEPGAQAEVGSEVQVTYSAGPPNVEVPSIVGQPEVEARTALEGAGLTVGDITAEPSDEFAEGEVIGSNPSPGTEVASGTAVDLVVSSGPPPIMLPNVDGMEEQEAIDEVQAACGEQACLDVRTVRAFSDDVEEGRVIRMDPAPGSAVQPGHRVTLYVSQGPEETETPTPTPTPSPTDENGSDGGGDGDGGDGNGNGGDGDGSG